MLRICTSLAHLNLAGNNIGTGEAGRLAWVLGQCASLAHLDLERRRWGGKEASGGAGAMHIPRIPQSF